MLENLNGRFDYSERIFDRVQPADLSDDYTLPDYMPAVGRVISCTATVAPPALYIGGGSIEYAGGVRYRLLYESADDSSLWCAELPAEYDILLSPDKIPADPAEISGLAEATADNVTARITAPRRLTVKSRIRLRPMLSANSAFETTIHGGANDPTAIRTLSGNAFGGIITTAASAPITCRDKISHAEAGLSPNDEIRVISSHGNVMISQLQNNGTDADCRGEIDLSLMIVRDGEGERPRRIIRKLPFSSSVQFEPPLDPNARRIGIRGYGVCPSVNITAEEDGIAVEANLILSVEAAAVKPISYLKDIYSKNADCESSVKKLMLRTPVACFNGNATVSSGSELEPLGLDGGMKLSELSVRILPDIESSLSENGKLTVNGKMKISAVADNGAELIPAEFDSDFKYVSDIPEASSLSSPDISVIATVGEVKGRIDSDRIVCDCELCTAVLIENKAEIEALSEVNLTSASLSERSNSSICVCYPAAGETLWDIAKKYRTDASTIAEKNSLDTSLSIDSADSLAKSKFLII